MKRVGCLYRVSTAKQLYCDDIPMQRRACRNFIETKEQWALQKEYYEKGISGYKLSENQRDVLKEIKSDVLFKRIDVLLVFMFDRIGRQESETPFIVEWLINKGIEVWSVKEGQRKIENRIDKLLNYMTFWSAEGESEKTSIRATERRIQLTKEGIYMGNYAPFGYELVTSDELVSKIGKKRKVLKIYEKEAKTVRLIFKLIANEKYGMIKVAKYLNEHEIYRRNGKRWYDSNVSDIVKNPIYKGYVTFMKRTRRKQVYKRNEKETWIMADKANPEIVITPEYIFDAANELIESRRRPGERKIRLLSEMVKCGYCNGCIVPRQKKDSKYTYMRCKKEMQYKDCEYHANYRLDYLEPIIINEINRYLDNLEKVDYEEEIKKKNIKRNELITELKTINNKINNYIDKEKELKKEIIKTLLSNNEEDKIDLNSKIVDINEKINSLEDEKSTLEKEIQKLNKKENKIKNFVLIWRKEFNESPLETKREVLKTLINKIYLYNDKIVIDVKYPINEQKIEKEIS